MNAEDTLQEARERIGACTDADTLKGVEREYVGKKGAVAAMLAEIPRLEPEARKAHGQKANALKQAISELVAARREELDAARLEDARRADDFDATLPPPRAPRGSLHPITQVTRELEDLFVSMGYEVLDGPEVELDHYNFEALNITKDHPARDSQDTFYCDAEGHLVLRTHTSPVQVRAMEKREPPFRVIAPGRVFRQETTDASHDHTFYQMEGLVVGRDISVAHLIGAMKTLLRGIFGRDLDVRLRPGHFPFVEPGFELDARCPFCESGCRVCKKTTWIELLPCGLVHPNVLRAGGIDPDQWSGFAFGLGLSRLVMLRYDIDDVRHLLDGDLRFLEQF
ncbi:MAG: phenylalanine--tRNA ligase subunit alpha [Deltaproteobacteria bacterium]|jgi:phenylalanyl-tRNA synthetase alpha chain|nr:phenylalanine--tRNA ligase subunit alpha [Deltaproteobacteria bacterium]MBW2495702.1 phenylalanine--tRNA ligase subunit alpha [Deltaproteobacteria bacterium]